MNGEGGFSGTRNEYWENLEVILKNFWKTIGGEKVCLSMVGEGGISGIRNEC